MVVIVAAVAACGGCALSPESSPRDVSVEQQGVFEASPTGDEATGNSRVYLLGSSAAGSGEQQLRSVLRDVPNNPTAVIESLLAGPNDAEREALFDTALPRDLVVNSARLAGDVLAVDVNDALTGLTQDGLRLAVAQIVMTASEQPDVNGVLLRVDGESQAWPLGDGELAERALTAFDYIALVESTQPSFPPVPAGERS
jgi:spore germination protein GerM